MTSWRGFSPRLRPRLTSLASSSRSSFRISVRFCSRRHPTVFSRSPCRTTGCAFARPSDRGNRSSGRLTRLEQNPSGGGHEGPHAFDVVVHGTKPLVVFRDREVGYGPVDLPEEVDDRSDVVELHAHRAGLQVDDLEAGRFGCRPQGLDTARWLTGCGPIMKSVSSRLVPAPIC